MSAIPRRRLPRSSPAKLLVAFLTLCAGVLVWPAPAFAAKPAVTLTSPVVVSDQSVTINYAVNRKARQVRSHECSLSRGTTVVATTCGTLQGSDSSKTRYRTIFTGLANGQYVYRVRVTLTDSGAATLTTPAFTINFTPPNRAPVAAEDSYTTDYETPLVVPAPGLLVNDSDPDGDTIRVSTVNLSPGPGSLDAGLDGSFVFTPPDGFSGVATFSYRIRDTSDEPSADAAISITVNPPA
jgi:hypothetical protein